VLTEPAVVVQRGAAAHLDHHGERGKRCRGRLRGQQRWQSRVCCASAIQREVSAAFGVGRLRR
jgi:hypothetical protein